ncbi:hypothetical protein [Desulfobacter sp.]|uniref:hypothetical protein n=1 Tax=Desulfobacter sp. TaxID=2294 RepID=UPI003D0DE554
MDTKQLTDLINHRLGIIKQDFNALPTGGSLESLQQTLLKLIGKTSLLVEDIDRLNGLKNPENALKK